MDDYRQPDTPETANEVEMLLDQQAEQAEDEPGDKSAWKLKSRRGPAAPGPKQPKTEKQPAGQNKGQNIAGTLQLAEGAKKHPQS